VVGLAQKRAGRLAKTEIYMWCKFSKRSAPRVPSRSWATAPGGPGVPRGTRLRGGGAARSKGGKKAVSTRLPAACPGTSKSDGPF